MDFEALPPTPTAEELLDQAFSRGARAGRAKSGLAAQQSMLRTATNVVHDNLENVVTGWPDTRALPDFDRELAGAVLRRTWDADGEAGAGINALRQHLAAVSWAAEKAKDLGREYEGRLTGDLETARGHREQAYARLADVVEEIADDLEAIESARLALTELPEIVADEPAIVVAGAPNTGKSTFVNRVTNANNETASYPFTTTQVAVGHLEREHVRYQLVDTPGLLDRPDADRNDIERQAVSALTHLADCVLVFVDASEACGYPLEEQLTLRDEITSTFAVPAVTVCTKADRSRGMDADAYAVLREDVDIPDGEPAVISPEAVVDLAVDTIGYEPELPYEG
ncbi:MAG: NOG1 family protein [Halobacteriaceae archaeon]